MRREAVAVSGLAAAVAAVLLWLGPPGADSAAHVYQRQLLLDDGFALWNNFWYAGRYSFVTYSLGYYPVAALIGIRVLALVSVAASAGAFALVARGEWGRAARWPSIAFAVAWGCTVLSGAFPFLAASAAALIAIRLLQSGRQRWAVPAIVATLVLSPLAFLLLAVVLVAAAIAHRPPRATLMLPAAAVSAGVGVEIVLWRLFPDGGRYPRTTPRTAGPTGSRPSRTCTACSGPPTASRLSTLPVTGRRATCPRPGSRSLAAGSARTTSRRTESSTTISAAEATSRGCTGSRCATSCSATPPRTTAPSARHGCCAAGAPGSESPAGRLI
jgi:hypothetical protein